MDFEWDYFKEKENLAKHGVNFTEAQESFLDQEGFSLEDLAHSEDEPRFYWIGKSSSGRILTTRYTQRVGKIRIIGSAEWRKFRKIYNERACTKKSSR